MKLPLLLAFVAATSLKAAPIVLLDDKFDDGDRTTQSLPGSSRWYYLGGSGSMSASNHTLNWNIGSGYASALTYFSAAPIALEVGDTLTASLTLAFDNIGATSLANSLRIGLFNSGGTRVSADVPGSRFNPTFNNYAGYYGNLNPLSTAANTFSAYRRGNTANQDLFTLSSLYLSPSGNSVLFQEDTPLQVITRVTRTATGVAWSFTIGGTTIQGIDVGSSYFSFDTLALYVAGPTNTAQNLLLSNINVEVIPEAQSALLILLGAGILIMRRNGRAGASVTR
jgi:hypothetical protein